MASDQELSTNMSTEGDFSVTFVGGTAAVTKLAGPGVAVSYVSTGIVELTWSSNETPPGKFIGLKSWGFRADTPANIKAYTCVAGAYSTTTKKLRINMYDASNNLVDLAALQWLTVTLMFVQEVSVPA
ncbi:MAG: hypothetical protein ACM358_11895 [Gemmatimonadota bacterium]